MSAQAAVDGDAVDDDRIARNAEAVPQILPYAEDGGIEEGLPDREEILAEGVEGVDGLKTAFVVDQVETDAAELRAGTVLGEVHADVPLLDAVVETRRDPVLAAVAEDDVVDAEVRGDLVAVGRCGAGVQGCHGDAHPLDGAARWPVKGCRRRSCGRAG